MKLLQCWVLKSHVSQLQALVAFFLNGDILFIHVIILREQIYRAHIGVARLRE